MDPDLGRGVEQLSRRERGGAVEERGSKLILATPALLLEKVKPLYRSYGSNPILQESPFSWIPVKRQRERALFVFLTLSTDSLN